MYRQLLISALFLPFLGILLSSCAPKPPHPMQAPEAATAALEGSGAAFQAGQIVDTRAGERIAFAELIQRLQAQELVFIGEVHTNAEHHLIQVQILQTLLDNAPETAVGIEYLPHTLQPVLDRFMSGQINETEFFNQTDWLKNWGFDAHLYRPLFYMIRREASGLLALNAPNAVIKAVARKGLQGLTSGQRNQLAADIALDNAEHRAVLQEIFKNHAHSQLPDFELFYQAQCARDATMAANIAADWKAQGRRMVVFCGNGHLDKRFGVPGRVQSRIADDSAVLLLKPLQGSMRLDPAEADYVWLTRDDM